MHPRMARPRPLLLLVALAFALAASVAARQREPRPLSVMSFNIRYATDRDAENRWTARRSMLFDLLRRENPDIIGVQEALDSQLSEILRQVNGYSVLGVGRDDGRAAGEYSAILFRSTRFRVAQSGTFWLSATPEVIASRTWGNRIPRICSWARLIADGGQPLWVYNVHLDHESQPSREQSVRLLLERIRSRPVPGEPVIVTGDFNVGEGDPALEPLLGKPGEDAAFLDTFRMLHPGDTEVGTYTAFEFGRTKGAKIDYVLVEPGTEVLRAGILRYSRNRRYPSDHFPVVATIRVRAHPPSPGGD
jgi:endonuclease/exonuclease/phosphatase family metal-dependent hydrolase